MGISPIVFLLGLTRTMAFNVMLREIEIRIDLAPVQIVEVDALHRYVGGITRRYKAEHSTQYTTPAGSLFV